MEFDHDIDALGLLCPLPVLKAAKLLRKMAPGEVLRLQADDPAAVVDVPHYCRESGNLLMCTEADEASTIYYIRKT